MANTFLSILSQSTVIQFYLNQAFLVAHILFASGCKLFYFSFLPMAVCHSPSVSLDNIYWAKDIIFLVVDQNEIGIQSWLDEYHGIQSKCKMSCLW